MDASDEIKRAASLHPEINLGAASAAAEAVGLALLKHDEQLKAAREGKPVSQEDLNKSLSAVLAAREAFIASGCLDLVHTIISNRPS